MKGGYEFYSSLISKIRNNNPKKIESSDPKLDTAEQTQNQRTMRYFLNSIKIVVSVIVSLIIVLVLLLILASANPVFAWYFSSSSFGILYGIATIIRLIFGFFDNFVMSVILLFYIPKLLISLNTSRTLVTKNIPSYKVIIYRIPKSFQALRGLSSLDSQQPAELMRCLDN